MRARVITRRAAVAAIAGACVASCSRRGTKADEVVLYTSADDPVVRLITEAFERDAGCRVAVVVDTEATKATGLAARVIAERARPRAQVWWSSEPLATIRLARAGLLRPLPDAVRASVGADWPSGLIASDGTWIGFAQRARVIAAHDSVTGPPATLREFVSCGARLGMARPQFGTTRVQMAAIMATHGEGALRAWLAEARRASVRIFDGNSTVVRAIANREIDIGLTDTDDCWAAQRNGWPVRCVFERGDKTDLTQGPLMIPNTVALPAGAPDNPATEQLAAFLLSAAAEQILADSDSHNVPVRAGVTLADQYRIPHPWTPDWSSVADADEPAARIAAEVLM